MSFGQRLAEERKRIELNQTDFARIGGVTKTSQVNYEASERSPNVDYWQAIAAIGADVNYILTGKRSAQDRKIKALADLMDSLSPEQRQEILSGIAEKKRLNELEIAVNQLRKAG